MTQKVKFHNNESVEFDNDYYNDFYLFEQCFYCQKDFIHIKDVLVDTERDRYVCQECADKRNMNTVPCISIN